MVTKFVFLQDFFGFSKNGQKKCPKMKIPKYFWKKNKVNIINSSNYLKNVQKRSKLVLVNSNYFGYFLNDFGAFVMRHIKL
jgi:hypothetical protein